MHNHKNNTKLENYFKNYSINFASLKNKISNSLSKTSKISQKLGVLSFTPLIFSGLSVGISNPYINTFNNQTNSQQPSLEADFVDYSTSSTELDMANNYQSGFSFANQTSGQPFLLGDSSIHAVSDKPTVNLTDNILDSKLGAASHRDVNGNIIVTNQQMWQDELHNLITLRCEEVGCNPEQLIRVMWCESETRPMVEYYGAKGLFQFIDTTYAANANRLGIENPDIWNPEQQIYVATQMFAEHQAWQWGCK